MAKKRCILPVFLILSFLFFGMKNTSHAKDKIEDPGYIIEQDSSIAVIQPGPHDGGGETIGHAFFKNIPDFDFVFKKRILRPGSAIGYHLQEHDEIYYILSGEGELSMDGELSIVKAGTAILTRPGTSHGLRQTGSEDLIIFIIYPKVKT